MDNRINNVATDEERQEVMRAVIILMRLSERDHQMAQERAIQQRESLAVEGISLMSRSAVACLGSFPDGPRLVDSGHVSQ